MKENKLYFGKNNRLNKGYASHNSTNNNYEEKDSYSQKVNASFPPLNIIKSFEELSPGSIEKIIKLAEKEQKHRQEMEKTNSAIYEKLRKLGMFFSFLALIIISFVTLKLFYKGFNWGAIIFAITSFAGVFGVSLFSYFKTMETRENIIKKPFTKKTNKFKSRK